MKIRRSAVGNKSEAFVEAGYSEGFNIISSDDNNKGKTIAIQSLMYALGNEPTFPTTFDYKNYYHFVEFEVNGSLYKMCRNDNNFVLKSGSALLIFDGVSEMKRYWSRNIIALPRIAKNQISRIVDPVLLFQLFFVGQDKKDTSNIAHNGFYNKQDFLNMLFEMCGAADVELDVKEAERIKGQIKGLKEERETLLKQHSILKSQNTSISFLSSVNDRAKFSEKVDMLERISDKIVDLKKFRNLAATRKSKWETTLKELRSLNRTVAGGELHCMECHSTNISFSSAKKNGYTFDVSSAEMRSEIIISITEKINAYKEEIEDYTRQINVAQDELNELMADESITLEALVAYKEEIFSATDAEKRIREVEEQIAVLNSRLQANSERGKAKKEKREEIISRILEVMNDSYRIIDPNGNLYFETLFTGRNQTYSGSEATVFHLVRLYAFWKILGHDYPIVVDSFRAEDLSTTKESSVIELFSSVPNQIIFTTTLKDEELGKYDRLRGIHHLDYKDHVPSKMLDESYLTEFIQIMESMSIKM